MKTLKLLPIFFALFFFSAQAQKLKLSTDRLIFPVLNEKQTDSLSFTLTNPTSNPFPATVRIMQPFRIYGSNPFWVKDTLLTIPANSSATVWVYCRIKHNTPNPSNLILKTKWNVVDGGDLRVALSCQGKYSKIYYNSTQNLSEETLKQALKTRLAQNFNSFSYDQARDKMYGQIDNYNDSVTCVYTNRKAKFNTTGSGPNGSNTANFNCEHTFPQGFFGQALPMRSDIHHLYSTDDNANNSRGNLPFGVATAPFLQVSINAPSKNGGGKYEPQDSHKGNCARAMMYFVLRYQDYNNFYAPQDAILRQWHKTFPPLPKDTMRNAEVFAEQNNRNPFIDYPQFADRIKNLVGISRSDSVRSLGISDTLVEGDLSTGGFYEPGDTLSVVLWNQGNQRIQIQNLKFANSSLANGFTLLGGEVQNFSLGYNEARIVRFTFNDWQNDFLQFETNDPLRPSIQIPVYFLEVSNQKTVSLLKPSFYPNPASDVLSFDFRLGQNLESEITLSNLQGKTVKSFQTRVLNGKTSVSIADLPSGIYQAAVKQNGRTDHFRFVKN